MYYTRLFVAFLCIACAYGVKPVRQDMTQKQIYMARDLIEGLDRELEKFNKDKRPQQAFRFVRHSIIKAQQRNVSGPVYYVEEKMVESTCKNVEENDNKTIKECPAKPGRIPLICTVKVWSRQWLKDESKRLTVTMKCMKMGKVDAGRQDMTEKEISAAKDMLKGLDLQVEKFNNKSLARQEAKNHTRNYAYRYVRHSIVKAQKHIMAGTMYYVEVKMVESTCKNTKENRGRTIEACPAKDKAVPIICLVEVWSHKWMKYEAQRLTVTTKCLKEKFVYLFNARKNNKTPVAG